VNDKIRLAVLLALSSAAPCLAHAETENTASASGGTLEEIVITAQKRAERLQDVPVAASVVSTEALSQRNAGDITDLNNIVPSVNLNATINGRVPLGIRGISSNANEATVGLASGVAIMVDGIPVPSDSYNGNQLDDASQVEVLKGPQSTLGGRTASAGVINLVTRGPSDHFEGTVNATATDDKEYRGNVFISGPFSDAVEGSLFVYGNTRDYPITNLFNDENTTQRTDGIRGKLLFKVNDAFDVKLMGHYAKADSVGGNFAYTYITPGANLLFGTGAVGFPPPVAPTVSQAALLARITPSYSNLSYNSPVLNAGADVKDTDGSVILEYRFGGNTLTSTTGYQHETQTNIQDLFALSSYFSNNIAASFTNFFLNILHLPGVPPGTPASWAPFANEQTQQVDVKQTTEEIKLASSVDQDLSYLVGFFYSDVKVGLDEYRTFTPAAVNYFVQPDTKTYDLYGRGTWKVTPADSLIVGLRYNADRLSYSENQIVDAPYGAFASSGSDNSSAVVGDISFKHDLSANSMLYASYSRGYAPRVYNTALALESNAPVTPVGQEHVDNFEIGSKGFYLDHRLSVNVDVFDTIYHDYQIQSYSALPGAVAPPLILSNAGEAETRGLEGDLAFAPTATTVLSLSAAYIDAKFKSYTDAPCWGGTGQETAAEGCHLEPSTGQYVQNVSGDPLPNSPKFKATLGFEQNLPLANAPFDMVVGGTWSYRSRDQMLPDQNPEGIQGAFGLLDLNMGFKEKSGKYSVTLFANNLTNHPYYGDIEDFWTGPWGANAVVGQPARDAQRYVGARFRADF
jgi:iron complex outermembrane receptor protein